MPKFIVGISLILVPVGQLAADIILVVLGSNHGWMLAHSIELGSLFLTVAVILGLRQLLGPSKASWGVFADGGMVLALVGLLLTVSQITIDLTVGLLASTPVEMQAMYGRIQANPGMDYTFYSIGPALFFLGLLPLILLLARFRVLPLWSAGVAVFGSVLGVVRGFNVLPSGVLGLVSLVCLGTCFLPAGWKLLTDRIESLNEVEGKAFLVPRDAA